MYKWIALVVTIVLAFIAIIFLLKSGFLDDLAGGGGCLVRLLLLIVAFVACFFLILYLFDKIFDKYDYTNAYITTKQSFSTYEKISNTPYGQEIGTLDADTVIKVVKSKHKKSITWVEGYTLVNDKPEYITILIPAKVEIKDSTEYFDFNEKSASFDTYYNIIDSENEKILDGIKENFLTTLSENGIKVESSSDIVLKESIGKTHYILPKNGYLGKGFFGLYDAKNTDEFFYIEKSNKKRFKKIVNDYYKRLKNETIPYF